MKQFDEIYAEVVPVIAHDTKWQNSTGYYDHIVTTNLGLRPGEMAKVEAPDKRRIIVVGTRYGNVALFERKPPNGEERSRIVCGNYPIEVRTFFKGVCGIGSNVDASGIELILGIPHDVSSSFNPNIGRRIEDMLGK